MARQAKAESESTLLDQVQENRTSQEDQSIENMPLNSLDDYRRYNARARAMNKKLRVLRYPIKQCPVEMHPTQRIVFSRKDQPKNPLPVFLSNADIEFKKTLMPGQTYDLPVCVIDYLAKKGTPIWDWVEKANGEKETVQVASDPRFALRTVYEG
jgi:hypothetical protein